MTVDTTRVGVLISRDGFLQGIFGTRQVTHLPLYGPGEISLKLSAQPHQDHAGSRNDRHGISENSSRANLPQAVFPLP